jgi:subtilisin family serine protease
VVANGAIYFSSAANSGNVTNGTSTCWEGDFTDGGTLSDGPIATGEGVPVVVHEFSPGVNSNALIDGAPVIDLFWASPLGGATDDYDLFVLDSTGTTIKGFSTGSQNGTQDPYEEVAIAPFGNYQNPAAGDIIVIVRFAGKPRALHVESFGYSGLEFSTNGSTHGHNGGANTNSIAASYWNSAHGGLHFFNSDAVTEVFSSDGPRRTFFNPDGSPITPGNFKFATNGGTVLQKPDFTGADGITARTPGFNPFFGTSASAPHIAGVAALVWSANPGLTNTQVRTALLNSALDIGPPGFDPDSGFGIVRAKAAVDSVLPTNN